MFTQQLEKSRVEGMGLAMKTLRGMLSGWERQRGTRRLHRWRSQAQRAAMEEDRDLVLGHTETEKRDVGKERGLKVLIQTQLRQLKLRQSRCLASWARGMGATSRLNLLWQEKHRGNRKLFLERVVQVTWRWRAVHWSRCVARWKARAGLTRENDWDKGLDVMAKFVGKAWHRSQGAAVRGWMANVQGEAAVTKHNGAGRGRAMETLNQVLRRLRFLGNARVLAALAHNFRASQSQDAIDGLIAAVEVKEKEKTATKVFVEDMLADFDTDQQHWEAMQGEANTRKMKAAIQQSILYWRVVLGGALSRGFYTWMHIAVFRSMQYLEVTQVLELKEQMVELQIAVDLGKRGVEEEVERLKQRQAP